LSNPGNPDPAAVAATPALESHPARWPVNLQRVLTNISPPLDRDAVRKYLALAAAEFAAKDLTIARLTKERVDLGGAFLAMAEAGYKYAPLSIEDAMRQVLSDVSRLTRERDEAAATLKTIESVWKREVQRATEEMRERAATLAADCSKYANWANKLTAEAVCGDIASEIRSLPTGEAR